MAPGSGADLIFSGTTRTSTNDDLANGTAINSIELPGQQRMLAGNSINLTTSVTVDSGVTGGTISLNIAEPSAGTINLKPERV